MTSLVIRCVHIRLEALFVFMSFPFAFLLLRLDLVAMLVFLTRLFGGLACIGLRRQILIFRFLHEIVICGLYGRMPKNIFNEIRRVLLQKDFISLLEYFQHVVIKVLIQGYILMMLVLCIV